MKNLLIPMAAIALLLGSGRLQAQDKRRGPASADRA